MDEIGRAYVALGLRINQHFPGYVDAYIGGDETRQAILAHGPRSLADLREDADRLAQRIAGEPLPEPRKTWLAKQVEAMRTMLARLDGEIIPFREEAERCLDIRPERVPEAEFEAAIAEIDRLLPGPGPLEERVEAWKKQTEVAEDKVPTLLELARQEARRRTQALVDLPDGEGVEILIVHNQPWGGYNWYLGHYRSRIDVNLDLPTRVPSILPLMTHEGYPGHHTEHALKEKILYREKGWEEASIFLLNTPECVISEGIANVALDMIFTEDEAAAFLHDVLYPAAGLEHLDPERDRTLGRAFRKLAGVSGNVAFLAYEDGWSDDELVAYIQKYGLRSETEARFSLKFIRNPMFRTYIFTYFYGERMLRAALAGPDRREVFRRLLTEPLTPGVVAGWISQAS
ncbi:MAG: hypothetical protein Kow00123_24680 [Anaerolineales bacterium]